jgi:hypothetical protein
MDYPLLIVSNGFSVAKLATDSLLLILSAMDSPLLIDALVSITNEESVGDYIIFY